jgi:uncharacterized membrane protein
LDEKLDSLETLLFSVGISLAFLTISGLSVNSFAYLFNINYPLSPIPLLIVFNIFIFLGGLLICLRDRGGSGLLKINTNCLLSALPLIFVPILSIVGTMIVNVSGNNSVLIFMMIIIVIITIIIGTTKHLPSKFYPLATFLITISLLYHNSLISNYIVGFGSDVGRELYIFQNTLNKMYWEPNNPYPMNLQNGRMHAMLSVTILPTIYSTLLGIDSTWVFKLLFPFIFSFVPLGLFQLYKNRISEKGAFFAVFLFMAYETFYTEMLGLNRQIIAELFFVLLLFIILDNKNTLKGAPKTLCIVLFSFGLVTSHYGLAEVFLFFIFFTFIILFMLKHQSKVITISTVIIFFVLMFAWYIYTTNHAVFDSIMEYGEYVRNQLQDFFNPASRGTAVMRGLGLEAPPTIWNMISRAFAYLTELFIVVGFLDLIIKKRKTIDREYLILNIIAMILLGLLILVPGLANTMNMTRFYHILLFILSPLCIIGAEALCCFKFKNKERLPSFLLLLIVLIPYFLFQTSFVYEVVGSKSWSLPLSKYRMSPLELHYVIGCTNTPNVVSARWLTNYVDVNSVRIYADVSSRSNELFYYGLIDKEQIIVLNNITAIDFNSIIYLNKLNIIDNKIVGSKSLWNTTDFPFPNDLDIIYSNGISEINKR